MANQRNRSSLLLLLFVLFGIYSFIFGDSGLLERIRIHDEQKRVTGRISSLNKENKLLSDEYRDILDNNTKDGILKKEAVRSGYMERDDKLLFFKRSTAKEKPAAGNSEKKDEYTVDIMHLRILWLVASVMIILFYFGRKNAASDK